MSRDVKEKLIVALDVDNLDSACRLSQELAPFVGGFKVGLELLTNSGAPQVVSRLQVGGAKIFFDGKFKDIPNTVAAASRAVTRLGVSMFNVHCMGGRAMMEAAYQAAETTAKSSGVKRPLILGVTLLTSFDPLSLKEIGLDVRDEAALVGHVVRLAKLAKSAGLDGVVASPKEIQAIRTACGADFRIVTPGVRPSWAAEGDQKRVMTPAEAVALRADSIVVGRPITNPPASIGSPVEAVKKILEEM